MQFVAITAVGRDRPGIVAEVTGALFRLGCNLEETSMTRLRGEFAMLLLVRLPEGGSAEALEAAMRETGERMGLSVVVRPLAVDEAFPEPPDEPGHGYILRVYGADRPGIVHAVTALLAERGGNVTDLNTRLLPGAGGPVYVLLLEVDLPSVEVAEGLRPELERLKGELRVEISLEELDEEAL
jgi:glycine cleavage system transcriptional repressor